MEYQIVKEKVGYVVRDNSGKYEINLAERIFNFVIKIIQYLKKIPKSNINNIVISQLTKSVTSMGANYEEAQGAFSENEFSSKIGICLKEARETNYFYRLIKELKIGDSKECHRLTAEYNEL